MIIDDPCEPEDVDIKGDLQDVLAELGSAHSIAGASLEIIDGIEYSSSYEDPYEIDNITELIRALLAISKMTRERIGHIRVRLDSVEYRDAKEGMEE